MNKTTKKTITLAMVMAMAGTAVPSNVEKCTVKVSEEEGAVNQQK